MMLTIVLVTVVPKRIIKPDGTLLGENEVEELLSDEGSNRKPPSPSTSLTQPAESNDSPNSVNLPDISDPNSQLSSGIHAATLSTPVTVSIYTTTTTHGRARRDPYLARELYSPVPIIYYPETYINYI